MQFPNYNPQQLEPQIIEFWKKNNIVETLRKRNKKGKKFYFLDGPPYTSGKFHLVRLELCSKRYRFALQTHAWLKCMGSEWF